MNILFVVHSLAGGGAERVTANLANYWAEQGWRVGIVTLESSKQDVYILHPSITRISLDLAGDSKNLWNALKNNVCRILALRRVLLYYKPDIAVAMMSTMNIVLAIASYGLKGLKVGSERIHPPLFLLNKYWEWMRTYWYSQLNVIVVLTNESAIWIQQHTKAKQISIIPNAVVWPLPIHAPILPVQSIGNQLSKRLLAVGRLDHQKGFDLLIDAFAQLTPRYLDWELVIVGEGPLHQELQAKVDALKLQGRVLLPGRAGNISEWYAESDLFVLSSRYEGFPNALIEAMAHGLPAISFDCDTGPRDIIRHGIDGLLVPSENIVALETALEQLMRDSQQRNAMAEHALEVRERFSFEHIIAMWEELFNGFNSRAN